MNILPDNNPIHLMMAIIMTLALIGAWDSLLTLLELSQVKYTRMNGKWVYVKKPYQQYYDLRGEEYGRVAGKYYDDYMERDKVKVVFVVKATKEEKELLNCGDTRRIVHAIPLKFLNFKKGGEHKPSKAKFMKMPRIFRWAIALAVVVLVWKFVLNIEPITSFLVTHFLGK